MKRALVEPTNRICEVVDKEFPVHPTLKWVDVPDDTLAGDMYVNGAVVKATQIFTPDPNTPASSLLELIDAFQAEGAVTAARATNIKRRLRLIP